MKTYELKSSDDNYDYPETGTPNSLNSQTRIRRCSQI